MKVSVFKGAAPTRTRRESFGFRPFGRMMNWLLASMSPRKRSNSEAGKQITVKHRHRLFHRVLRRATSSHLEAGGFSTNTKPVHGLRLSTSNILAKDDRVTAARLKSRKSSAPITPRTMGRRRTFLSTDGLRKALARDSVVRRSFEAYAEEQYALENVVFMESLLEWRTTHGSSYSDARRLVDTFIVDGSCMQINISYAARTEIEDIMAEVEESGCHVVPSTLFDRASAEITTMMQGGLWGTFVSRGFCDRADSLADALERRSHSREYASYVPRGRSTTNGHVEDSYYHRPRSTTNGRIELS